MSVQSGMISEPPVNVNDSDHSEVTRLSIFLYSLRAEARVAGFMRGKWKQQGREGARSVRGMCLLKCVGSCLGAPWQWKQAPFKGERGCDPCVLHAQPDLMKVSLGQPRTPLAPLLPDGMPTLDPVPSLQDLKCFWNAKGTGSRCFSESMEVQLLCDAPI